MNYLIYLVHGGTDYYNEALYSLLSFYKYHPDTEIKIVLYTDNIAFFKEKLPAEVSYVNLSGNLINKWKGPINYIHRIKTKVLQDALSKFKGNILYVDTDTYFVGNADELFNHIAAGNLILDRCEGKLADNKGGIARKMKKFLKKQTLFSIKALEEKIVLNENFTVWNSGVTGYNKEAKAALDCTEELIDELYTKEQLFVMEQIALSYFFQKIKQPVAAEKFIHHYWYFKEFRKVLREFFNYHKDKPFLQLKDELHKIDPQYLSSEKRAYKKMTFWQKQWQKISKGRKWAIGDYTL